mgnify:CR=1 FL=1
MKELNPGTISWGWRESFGLFAVPPYSRCILYGLSSPRWLKSVGSQWF